MGSIQSKIQEVVKQHGIARIVAAFMFLNFIRNTLGRRVQDYLKNMPPGPIPLPVIGTFYTLSAPNTPPGLHKDFFRLFQKYGPIYTLYFGANKGVVLNTPELWYEALNEKQDATANRPQLESYRAINALRGVAMQNGAMWRSIRTVLQTEVTSKQNGEKAMPIILEEMGTNLAHLRDRIDQGHPVTDDFRQLCRRESLNIMMRTLFSVRFMDVDSPNYYEFQDWLRIIFEHLAQGSPSDFMPIMKYVPNAEEDHYRVIAKKMLEFIDDQINQHRLRLPKKNPEDYDFVDTLLKAQETQRVKGAELVMTDVDIRSVCFDSMAGAIDTASTTMEWMIFLLVNYPEVQRKVHKLLDEVIGPNRLPTIEDAPKLEYLTAVITECVRFKHFAPQGLPHEAVEDLTLGGYNIPKGTQIFLNYYSLHMNPKLWNKPEEFRPERFMEEEKSLLNTILHTETYFKNPEAYKFVPYGQGRRRCVGYGFGRVVLWEKVALWLHCFEWKSPTGRPLDIETETLGITLVPKDQQVEVSIRPAARLLKVLPPNPKIQEL